MNNDTRPHVQLLNYLLTQLVADLFHGLRPRLEPSESPDVFKFSVKPDDKDTRVFTLSFSEKGDLESVRIEFSDPKIDPILASLHIAFEELKVNDMKNLAFFVNVTCLITPENFLPVLVDSNNRLNLRTKDGAHGYLLKAALASGVSITTNVLSMLMLIKRDVKTSVSYNVIPYGKD